MDKDIYITPSQLTFVLVGGMISIGALTIPLDVVDTAGQDGWIACILGSIYPLYIIFIAQYLHKKCPKENILTLSNKYLGKFLGTVLNLIFVLFFLLMVTEVSAGMTNVLMIYMTPFLTRYKILMTMLLAPAFVAYKGIKVVGRTCEIIFYLTVLVFFIPIAALKEGSILNIMPVFGSGIINIVKCTKDTMLAYSGIEIIFLLYPFIKDNKKLKKSGIISIIIVGIIYTWHVFISIFYLGIDIIPKFLWPVVTVTEAITIPIINSFRYIYMSLYTISIIKCIATFYYTVAFGFSEMTKVANTKVLCYFNISVGFLFIH